MAMPTHDSVKYLLGYTNITLFEQQAAIDEIRQASTSELNIIYGSTINEDLGDEVVITVIATGYDLKKDGEEPVDLFNDNKKESNEDPNAKIYIDEPKVEEKKQINPNLPDWLTAKK